MDAMASAAEGTRRRRSRRSSKRRVWMKGSQKRKRFFKPLEAGPGQLPPTIGHTHHTKVFALQKNFTTQHHLLVPHPKRGGMKEELDERSDLKGTRKVFFFFFLFLNGSSIFREATSPFDRATTFFNCGDNFCFFFVVVGKWWGDEKQTRTQIVHHRHHHTGHVQLWT
jgi:hypothetical protein